MRNKISHTVLVKLFPKVRITIYHLFTDSAHRMKSWQLKNHVQGLTWFSGCAHIERVVSSLSQLVLLFQLSTYGTFVKISGEELSFNETVYLVCAIAGTTAFHYARLSTSPAKPDSTVTVYLAVFLDKSPAFLFCPIICPDDDIKWYINPTLIFCEATMENWGNSSKKWRTKLLYSPTIPLQGINPKNMKTPTIKHTHPHVQWSIIYHSQDMKIT